MQDFVSHAKHAIIGIKRGTSELILFPAKDAAHDFSHSAPQSLMQKKGFPVRC